MTRFVSIAFLIIGFGVSASRADIVYFVSPETLSSGYSMSGFIKTNGTLGDLAPADILDYEINVTGGSIPYQFTPMNPGASISIGFGGVLLADPSLLVNVDLFAGSPTQSFTIEAADSSDPNCVFSPCTQTIRWGAIHGSDNTISYDYEDDISTLADGIAVTAVGSQQLVASVPEPSAFMFLSLVGFFGVGTSWWRNRRTQMSIHS